MASEHVVVASDPHSGHGLGLTGPRWQWNPRKGDEWMRLCARRQIDLWAFARHVTRRIPRIDWVFGPGDLIEGDDQKGGGVELYTRDRLRQCDISVDAFKYFNPRRGFKFTFGTRYHGGNVEAFEKVVADKLSAEIGAQLWPEIFGVAFDIKHYMPGSKKPELRPGKLVAEKRQTQEWVAHGRQPRTAITIRGHNHYYAEAALRGWRGFSCGALIPLGSRHGSLVCSGEVDVSLLHIEVFSNGSYRWETYVADLTSERARVTRLR